MFLGYWWKKVWSIRSTICCMKVFVLCRWSWMRLTKWIVHFVYLQAFWKTTAMCFGVIRKKRFMFVRFKVTFCCREVSVYFSCNQSMESSTGIPSSTCSGILIWICSPEDLSPRWRYWFDCTKPSEYRRCSCHCCSCCPWSNRTD